MNVKSLMFSAYFARTVNQRTRSVLFLPFIPRSVASRHVFSTPSYSHSTYSFSQAFHRTLGIQFRKLGYSHFSTLEPSHVQKVYETMNFTQLTEFTNESTNSGVIKLVKLLRSSFSSEGGDSTDFLDGSGIKPSEGLIIPAIWALRDEWKLAFFVFKWGQKWRCDNEKAWSLMIWVLGNNKKFSNAWCLIRDLYQSSMDTQRAMLIMIDRYAAANEPSEAIRAFQIMDKFKLSPDQKSFYTLLHTLCKHGNVEEAEEFMFLNTKLFPLETEGFNIILNGWCNIFVDIFESKRIWKEMDKSHIIPDETTYTHMISCFSKDKNLFDSLRLYDEMKKKGWTPNRSVYISLIYVLAHENCHGEAIKILEKMKEKGLKPDCISYNSLIRPLCEAGKLEDARVILSKMLEEEVNPNIDTYHAFLDSAGTSFEESLELVDRMVKFGDGANRDTFLILLGKFFQLDQVENALKIWSKMVDYEVCRDSAHFAVMVKGLLRHGLRVKAKEVYDEMICVGIAEDPKIKKILKESLRDYECRKIGKRGTRNGKYDERGCGKKWFGSGKRGKRSRT